MKNKRHLLLILYVPLYLFCFYLLERHVTTDYWVAYLPIDDRIPFLPGFVVFYVLWYPFMIGTGFYLLFRDVPTFKRYMWFIIIGFSLSLAICALFPNGQNLRPTVFADSSIFTRIVQALYRTDTNTNVLPSMHVVGCVAVVLAVFYCKSLKNGWIRSGTVLMATLISASTLLIKQHSVLDLLAALAVSVPVWGIVYGKASLRGKR
ncbi:MAG TPA: phosphatase PAP2 family protein [Clostridia bacterium]